MILADWYNHMTGEDYRHDRKCTNGHEQVNWKAREGKDLDCWFCGQKVEERPISYNELRQPVTPQTAPPIIAAN